MQAFVSLWSADLLAVGRALELLEDSADGFHVDIVDGHYVSELVFGPDFVHAVAGRTTLPVEVHLMVADADAWIERFAQAGARWLIVHRPSCPDPIRTLRAIGDRGVRPALALELSESPESLAPLLDLVDRVVLMGTEVGVKGLDIDEGVFKRLEAVLALRDGSRRKPELFVDGGIRVETVARLAQTGCDGVIPGSLVFGQPDWRSVVSWIQSLTRAARPTVL